MNNIKRINGMRFIFQLLLVLWRTRYAPGRYLPYFDITYYLNSGFDINAAELFIIAYSNDY